MNFNRVMQQVVLQNIENAERQMNRAPLRNFERHNAFHTLSDKAFIKMFRLTKHVTQQLIVLVDDFLEGPSRASALSKETKVLVALAFFASGSYQAVIGYNICCAVSQSSVSRCVNEVITALNNPRIFNEWVAFPTALRDLERVRSQFYNSYGIPGIVGVIDCTHVAIFPPPTADPHYPEHIYVNRKNYHSINVQLVCDSRLKILNVNARFPGSTHDAYIWSRSGLDQALQNLTERHPGFFLIGDSGYPLRSWLQTPVQNPEPDTPAYHYNEAFTRDRATIERCNGLLKMRFRCLLTHRVLHYSPTTAAKIINACVILHNMCIHNNLPNPEPEHDERADVGIFDGNIPIENNPQIRQNAALRAGRNVQQMLINNYSTP